MHTEKLDTKVRLWSHTVLQPERNVQDSWPFPQ